MSRYTVKSKSIKNQIQQLACYPVAIEIPFSKLDENKTVEAALKYYQDNLDSKLSLKISKEDHLVVEAENLIILRCGVVYKEPLKEFQFEFENNKVIYHVT